jgi:hypothetical protein
MLGRIVKATGTVTYGVSATGTVPYGASAAASEAARPASVEDVGPGGVPADEGGAPTYVQLTDRDALAGKTLERVEALWQKLFFVFADGTFVAVGIERDRHEYDNVSLTLDVPVDFDDRVTLGLPDAGDSREAIERHKEAKRREEEVMAARLRKMDEEIAIAVEATQRAEYERLKAKFEGAV